MNTLYIKQFYMNISEHHRNNADTMLTESGETSDIDSFALEDSTKSTFTKEDSDVDTFIAEATIHTAAVEDSDIDCFSF